MKELRCLPRNDVENGVHLKFIESKENSQNKQLPERPTDRALPMWDPCGLPDVVDLVYIMPLLAQERGKKSGGGELSDTTC
jgi:hypothetical protein